MSVKGLGRTPAWKHVLETSMDLLEGFHAAPVPWPCGPCNSGAGLRRWAAGCIGVKPVERGRGVHHTPSKSAPGWTAGEGVAGADDLSFRRSTLFVAPTRRCCRRRASRPWESKVGWRRLRASGVGGFDTGPTPGRVWMAPSTPPFSKHLGNRHARRRIRRQQQLRCESGCQSRLCIGVRMWMILGLPGGWDDVG